LEIKECHLPQSPLNDVWPLVEIEPETDISSFGLRVGFDEDILLTLKSPQVFEQEFNLESLPISVVHLSHNLEQVLAGNEYIFIEVGGRQFRVSARSFFQVNTQLAERMVSTVEELLPAKTNILLELYAGVGMFSAFLAKRVGKLLAIETSQSACDDFDYNLDDYDNVELYQGRVEDVIPLLDVKPDVVLIDPPRSGIDKKVLEHIITMSPKLLIYISCDPATLARDSQILVQGGYEPRSFLPIDLFSQTFHIETISFWVK
jgi:23S rRNA (uracil1939-C5)-methyltransferase